MDRAIVQPEPNLYFDGEPAKGPPWVLQEKQDPPGNMASMIVSSSPRCLNSLGDEHEKVSFSQKPCQGPLTGSSPVMTV